MLVRLDALWPSNITEGGNPFVTCNSVIDLLCVAMKSMNNARSKVMQNGTGILTRYISAHGAIRFSSVVRQR
jgi:hypothetical protein